MPDRFGSDTKTRKYNTCCRMQQHTEQQGHLHKWHTHKEHILPNAAKNRTTRITWIWGQLVEGVPWLIRWGWALGSLVSNNLYDTKHWNQQRDCAQTMKSKQLCLSAEYGWQTPRKYKNTSKTDLPNAATQTTARAKKVKRINRPQFKQDCIDASLSSS